MANQKSVAKFSRRPVESALYTRRPVAARNIPTDLAQKHWRADALKRHYGAFLAFPLIYENDSLGVLVIYATEPEAFVDQEVESLFLLCESIAQAVGPGWQKVERRE